MSRRAATAQERTRSTGEHGANEAAWALDVLTPHGEHAPVKAVKAAALHSPPDALTREPKLVKLFDRHHSVLAGSEKSQALFALQPALALRGG